MNCSIIENKSLNLNDCLSSELLVKCVVLQDGVLRPILFNIYIADIIDLYITYILSNLDIYPWF